MTTQDIEARATRVVIVDDHRMFVDSLVRLLGDEPDLVVVAVANTVAGGVEAAAVHKPDVVLLDFRLPDGDAPSCIVQLRDVAPGARVLVMTGLSDEATLAAARNAQCAGVVTKDRAARDLLDAVRAVASGATVTPGEGREPRDHSRRSPANGRTLSPRERVVLEHLAAGHSTTEVAASLHISSVTVRNHIQRLLSKLGAHSRLEAVAIGIEVGVIAPPPHRQRPS